MLTGKERARFRSQANLLKPIVMIGKDGLSETVIDQIDQIIEIRELIKIKIQNNSAEDARNVAEEVAKELHAEVIQVIGGIVVLYREAKEEENNEE